MTIKSCLTSKERVEAVFAGDQPDRTPVAFYAIDSDTAAKILGRPTYWRAKAKSQIGFWEGRRDEVVQSWIEDGIELYKKLDFIDIVPVTCEAAGVCPPKDYDPDPPRKIDEKTWEGADGKVYRYSPTTQDITVIEDPTSAVGSIDLTQEIWDEQIDAPDASIFEAVDALAGEFGMDRFVVGRAADELAWFLPGGMETGFMEVALRPDEVKAAFMSKVAQANALDKHFLRPGQSGVLWGTDLACQNGPMLSPQMYRDLFLDGFSQRIASVKAQGMRVIKHMCGNNWPLLDMMVEAGIDCYQSVQASAGMDVAEVQAKYADRFVVWGGLPVELLLDGTADDVRKCVRQVMTEVAPHGRFIFGTSHSIAVGTKYDNFMAMLDELHHYL